MLDVLTRETSAPSATRLPTAPRPAAGAALAGRARPWLGLGALLAAALLNLLDSTVSNVAAPSIRASLGGSLASLQWIAAGYTLALAVGLLTGDRLGDMFGRKRMWLGGIVGFRLASLARGLATSTEVLIGARVLQGLAGALMIPQTFGLLRDLFGPAVGTAFAALGPAIGLASILGPVVAGLLIDANLFGSGWRMVFLINLALGTLALVVGWRVLPSAAPTAGGQRLDVRGALLAAAGMLLLVYPLVQGRELGWPAWTLGLLGAAVVVLVVFGWYQWRRARTGAPALIELSIFGQRGYTAGVLFVIVFFGVCVGFSLAVGLLLQLGLHYRPLEASLSMLGWALGAFVGTALGSTQMQRLGRHIIHLGLSLMVLGLAGLYVVLASVGTQLTGWTLLLPLLVFGIGMGMIFAPLFDITLSGLRDHEIGSASGLLESIQQLGASLGVAVLGTVFFSGIGAQADAEQFVRAAMQVSLLTLELTGLAIGCGFLLPRRGRGWQAGH